MHIIINTYSFPIYEFFLILSIISYFIFNYFYLKNKIEKRIILLSFILIIIFALLGALIFDTIIHLNKGFQLGLSSYGGVIGIIIALISFSKMYSTNKKEIFTSYILSLPLIYGIAKIGCFLAGCCYGIPYNGIFNVTYTYDLNISLFPIQLLESIVFIILFIFMNKLNKKNPNQIIEKTIIICAFAKFTLDFLRYNHLEHFISINQIVSILIILITVLYMMKNKFLIKTT